MISVLESFGFHTKYSMRDYAEFGKEFPRKVAIRQNVTIIMGYFPLSGLVAGISRIQSLREDYNQDAPWPYKAVVLFRAVVEMLGVGLLFLIPDLIVSIGRHVCGLFSEQNWQM